MPESLDSWLKYTRPRLLGSEPSRVVSQAILDLIGFTPTGPEQAAILWATDWQQRPLKTLLVSGGIQSGKSYLTAAKLLIKSFYSEILWLCGPDYVQARPEARYLARWLADLGLLDAQRTSMPEGGDAWTLWTTYGCKMRTFSTGMPQKMAGESPDVVALLEAGQGTPEALEVARMRVTSKRKAGATQGDLWLVGTLEKSGQWYRRLYQRWQQPNPQKARSFNLPSWTNTYFYPGGRQDPAIVALEHDPLVRPERFQEQIAGVPTTPPTLVLRDFDPLVHVRQIRLGEPPPDWQNDGTIWLPPDSEVDLWIDPGFGGSTYAILALVEWQGTWHQIDELYFHRLTTKEMIRVAKLRPWWRYVRRGVIDRAGAQHHANESVWDVWREVTGLRLDYQKAVIPEAPSIERLRDWVAPDPITGQPRYLIDQACRHTIWEFGEAWVYPDNGRGEADSDVPRRGHDHAAAAARYGFWLRTGPGGNLVAQSTLRVLPPTPHDWDRRRRLRAV